MKNEQGIGMVRRIKDDDNDADLKEV